MINNDHELLTTFYLLDIIYLLHRTYSAPAVREETLVLGPVVGIHVKHARRHNKDPDGEIDGIQHVVEY